MDSQPASVKNDNDDFFPDFRKVKADNERNGVPPNVEFMLSLPATEDSKMSEITIFKKTSEGIESEERQLIHWDESVQLELKKSENLATTHILEGNESVIEVVHMGSIVGKDKTFFFRWPKPLMLKITLLKEVVM